MNSKMAVFDDEEEYEEEYEGEAEEENDYQGYEF
jgi:hypothetical protein